MSGRTALKWSDGLTLGIGGGGDGLLVSIQLLGLGLDLGGALGQMGRGEVAEGRVVLAGEQFVVSGLEGLGTRLANDLAQLVVKDHLASNLVSFGRLHFLACLKINYKRSIRASI